jgi:integrase
MWYNDDRTNEGGAKMTEHVRKQKTDNVITLSLVNGKLAKKPEIRYNKDGSVDKRHSNRVSGVSSEVYPFTTQEEIKRIIDVFNKRIDDATNDNQRQIARRNKMLFVIGINLGIRASDLVTLRYNFFMNNDGTFKEFYSLQPKKTRKTKKFVKLYFNQTVKKAITEYVEEYSIQDLNDFMFKSRKGDGSITERSLWKIIVDVADDARLESNYGSHSLRKTFGYWVWHNAEDKNKALVTLQVIFNHTSTATTARYIGLTDGEVSTAFNSLDLGLNYI